MTSSRDSNSSLAHVAGPSSSPPATADGASQRDRSRHRELRDNVAIRGTGTGTCPRWRSTVSESCTELFSLVMKFTAPTSSASRITASSKARHHTGASELPRELYLKHSSRLPALVHPSLRIPANNQTSLHTYFFTALTIPPVYRFPL